MNLRLRSMLHWLKTHPVAIINITFILIAVGLFLYLMNKPIDVLRNWKIEITDATYRDNKPVYNPGDTLVFRSQSEKLVDAEGTTTRVIVCEASGDKPAREIQLDTTPANRAAGKSPSRDNAITIPDVAQFNGLPRNCYISFDVCYQNVILWRGWCEHNRTETFIVEEAALNSKEIQKQIDGLNQKIKELQDKLASFGVVDNGTGASQSTASNNSTGAAVAQTPKPVATAPSSNPQTGTQTQLPPKNDTSQNNITPPTFNLFAPIANFLNGIIKAL